MPVSRVGESFDALVHGSSDFLIKPDVLKHFRYRHAKIYQQEQEAGTTRREKCSRRAAFVSEEITSPLR